MAVSSANRANLTVLLFGMSLVYSEKMRGDSTEPWGTPARMG